MIIWRLIFVSCVGGWLTVGVDGWLTVVFLWVWAGAQVGVGGCLTAFFFLVSQGFRQWMTDTTPTCNPLQLLQHTQDWHVIFKD
jgi:hypothetical protein